jgi:hypothetical protein
VDETVTDCAGFLFRRDVPLVLVADVVRKDVLFSTLGIPSSSLVPAETGPTLVIFLPHDQNHNLPKFVQAAR